MEAGSDLSILYGDRKRPHECINKDDFAGEEIFARQQSETSVAQIDFSHATYAAEALLSLSSNHSDSDETMYSSSKLLKINSGSVINNYHYIGEEMRKIIKDKEVNLGPGLQTRNRPCAQLAKIENHAPSKTKANKGTGRELRFCFEKGVSGYQIFFPNPPEHAEIVMKFVRYCKSKVPPPPEDFTKDDFTKFVHIFNHKEKNTRHSTTLLNVASFLTCYSEKIFEYADNNDCDIEELLIWLENVKKLGKKQYLICGKCRKDFLVRCEDRRNEKIAAMYEKII